MVPPGLPTPCPKRRRPLRWLRGLAGRFDPWGLVALLLAGSLLWVVGAMPLQQTVEGTVKSSSISFDLRQPPQGAAATGFLAESVRDLRISGLGDETPVFFRLKGELVELEPGQRVDFQPLASGSFALKLQLPAGTRVENLHTEGNPLSRTGSRELVMDLRSPTGPKPGPSTPVELIITPPAAAEHSAEGVAPGELVEPISGLEAVRSGAAGSERRLPTPEGTFSLLLRGDARLRLGLLDPAVVFEPNLPVNHVMFSTVKPSAFDQQPLLLSSVRQATLHYGRGAPLELRNNQFLIIDPPGIQELMDLRMVGNGHELIVSISGQTHRLTTGLSPKRPSTVLNGTLLSRQLSPEQITNFYAVLAGVIGSMVVVFFRAY
ncbi:MAG: hypothetical protein VKN56_10465 [Cyanobacteriota bacterium]|nr:hypothetical protein [Cyanobacteriota bacterium]